MDWRLDTRQVWCGGLTYAGPPVGVQCVPGVTPAYGALLRVLTGVLATPVAVVTSHYEA